MKKKKLGILLFNGPESQDTLSAIGLSSAAVKEGIEVELFLMYEGALNGTNESLQELAKDKRVKVTVCTHSADELHAYKCQGFKYGSQYDNAFIANETDRYIAFI
jgi:sulfur relay (sulfurtransferase) complex TusBCD TusD component (DsrE family)